MPSPDANKKMVVIKPPEGNFIYCVPIEQYDSWLDEYGQPCVPGQVRLKPDENHILMKHQTNGVHYMVNKTEFQDAIKSLATKIIGKKAGLSDQIPPGKHLAKPLEHNPKMPATLAPTSAQAHVPAQVQQASAQVQVPADGAPLSSMPLTPPRHLPGAFFHSPTASNDLTGDSSIPEDDADKASLAELHKYGARFRRAQRDDTPPPFPTPRPGGSVAHLAAPPPALAPALPQTPMFFSRQQREPFSGIGSSSLGRRYANPRQLNSTPAHEDLLALCKAGFPTDNQVSPTPGARDLMRNLPQAQTPDRDQNSQQNDDITRNPQQLAEPQRFPPAAQDLFASPTSAAMTMPNSLFTTLSSGTTVNNYNNMYFDGDGRAQGTGADLGQVLGLGHVQGGAAATGGRRTAPTPLRLPWSPQDQREHGDDTPGRR